MLTPIQVMRAKVTIDSHSGYHEMYSVLTALHGQIPVTFCCIFNPPSNDWLRNKLKIAKLERTLLTTYSHVFQTASLIISVQLDR